MEPTSQRDITDLQRTTKLLEQPVTVVTPMAHSSD